MLIDKHKDNTEFINENLKQNSKNPEALYEDKIKHIQL